MTLAKMPLVRGKGRAGARREWERRQEEGGGNGTKGTEPLAQQLVSV